MIPNMPSQSCENDYFLKKTLAVGDTTLNIGYNDIINYQGVNYDRNSEGLVNNITEIQYLKGGVVKGGMNFNITEKYFYFIRFIFK